MQKASLMRRIASQPRKYAMALNRQYTLPRFMNTRWFTHGIVFDRYHKRCQEMWRGNGDQLPQSDVHHLGELASKGYTVLPPDSETRELALRIGKRFSDLMELSDYVSEKHNDPYRATLESCIENVEGIRAILEGRIAQIIEAFLKSNFKVFEVEMYRNFPNNENKRQWMWHFDNDAFPVYKLLFYITDTTPKNGPFAIHTMKSTQELFQKGFYNPYAPEKHLDALNDSSRFAKVPGPAGTAIFFQNNCVHRATAPIEGYRDIVSFMVQPSLEPWGHHFDRMGSYLCHTKRFPLNQPLDPELD